MTIAQNVFLGARVRNSGSQSLTSGVFGSLNFDTNEYDSAGFHSVSVNTSRLTVPVAGEYAFAASVSMAASATGFRILQVIRSGGNPIARVSIPSVGAGNNSELYVGGQISLAAGEYLEVQAYQTSGGALNSEAHSDYAPTFAICCIDPLLGIYTY